MKQIKVVAALGCSPASAVSAQPHTNLRRATAVAALTALIALSACGSDGTTASETSTLPAGTAASPTSLTQPSAAETSPSTETNDTSGSGSATGDDAIARAALLQPGDIGPGWQDFGPDGAFPMTAELAASVQSCATFVDVVFEGNAGVWASTSLGRNMDIAFTSVTLFPTETEAAAMVAATATPEFDQCWADFNEVAAVALPFGITSASYKSVEAPDVELGGDSSSLHALSGTITLGSTNVADSCVCAFVQQGRTVVTFHSAAAVFSDAARSDAIAAALAQVDETVK